MGNFLTNVKTATSHCYDNFISKCNFKNSKGKTEIPTIKNITISIGEDFEESAIIERLDFTEESKDVDQLIRIENFINTCPNFIVKDDVKFKIFKLQDLHLEDVNFLMNHCATFDSHENIGFTRIIDGKVAWSPSQRDYHLKILTPNIIHPFNGYIKASEICENEDQNRMYVINEVDESDGNVVVIDDDNQITPVDTKPEVKLNVDTILPFDLANEVCIGYVVGVYDGDTITANLKTSIGIHKWKIRMFGYDCPEIKPTKTLIPDEKERELHKKHGKTCAALLRQMVLNKFVLVKCRGLETKWGRLLSDVFIGNNGENVQFIPETFDKLIHVNKWMLENTTALPYDGGTKQQFDFSQKQSELYESVFNSL